MKSTENAPSPFPPVFFSQDLRFDQEICCQWNKSGQIDISPGKSNRESIAEVASRIRDLDLIQLEKVPPLQREQFLCNLLSLRSVVPQDKPLFSLLSLKQNVPKLPFTLKFSTCGNLDTFSDPVQCPLFHMVHFSTYPRRTDLFATDHGGIRELPQGGFHMVVCDGLGHSRDVGRVAAAVAQTTLAVPLSEKIKEGRGEIQKETEAYRAFLRPLLKEYVAKEGTTLLEAQLQPLSSVNTMLTLANFGDCALIVLDPDGHVTFSTRDRKMEKILVKRPNIEPFESTIGTLSIGGGQPETQLQYLAFHQTILSRGSIVIACSDGLSGPFVSKETGLLDRPRFESACRTGIYYPLDAPLPKLPPKKLDMKALSNNLTSAAKDWAQQANDGDDVTIILVKT